MVMTRVKSSPVTLIWPAAPFCPGVTSTLVMTPSNSGAGVPLIVTISRIRKGILPSDSAVDDPVAIRKISFNTERLLILRLI